MSFYNFYDNNGTCNFNEGNQSSGFSEENIKSAYEKYKDYSQNELYNEFLKETARQKANGSLNRDKLMALKDTIMPYLSQEEQQTLNQIFNDIM